MRGGLDCHLNSDIYRMSTYRIRYLMQYYEKKFGSKRMALKYLGGQLNMSLRSHTYWRISFTTQATRKISLLYYTILLRLLIGDYIERSIPWFIINCHRFFVAIKNTMGKLFTHIMPRQRRLPGF